MISLKELQESNISIKSLAIWLLIIPFWFVAFYIYYPILFKINLIVPASLAFCLSAIGGITSSALISNIAGNSILEDKGKETDLDESDLRDQLTLGYAGIGLVFQVMFLSSQIFLGYLFYKLTDYIFTFFGFISFYFGILFVLFFIVALNVDKINTNHSQNTPDSNK